MSLEHAILGFLNYEPMSGYDLKKMVAVSVSHFWPAAQSQIYRTLDRMESRGLLVSSRQAQEKRPAKRLYSITQEGREAFLAWLGEPQEPGEQRLAWLIQVFFAGNLGDERILGLLEHQIAARRRRLGRFTAIREGNRERMAEDEPRNRFFWMITLDYGECQTRSQLEWLEKIRRLVLEKDYDPSSLGKEEQKHEQAGE